MGSTVSWLPHQPLCVSSISKAGQLVLQDVRLLGRPLLQQQLEGPVYDAVWMLAQPPATAASAAGAAAGAAGAAAAAGGSGVTELQLVVAGRDSRLRAYCLTATALQQGASEGLWLRGVEGLSLPAADRGCRGDHPALTCWLSSTAQPLCCRLKTCRTGGLSVKNLLSPAGHLAGPQLLSTPDSYSGSVLAVAATADGRRLAAAGEAVEADTLQPAQQQRQQQQQQVQQELPRVAARRGSAAARRGRSKAAAGLDLLSMSGERQCVSRKCVTVASCVMLCVCDSA
jgi:hypothetical protein